MKFFSCSVLVLFAFLFFGRPAIALDQEVIDLRIRREIRRFELTATDGFMEILAIRPGMTILDLGTGTGQFAYACADRLKGTGKVYATDINTTLINYVKREAAKRGLANLYPVLVASGNLDEVYTTQKFDLILILNTSVMRSPDFIARLRDSLAQDGRLIVSNYKTASRFSIHHFKPDISGLISEILGERPDSPFYKSLKESTRDLLKQNRSDDVLKNAIVEYFNDMLNDYHFGSNFVEGSSIKKNLVFSPVEKDFADYLLLSIFEGGLFTKNKEDFKEFHVRPVTSFNKLILVQKFRKHFSGDYAFIAGTQFTKDYDQIGYKLEHEYKDLLPYQYILVYKANVAGGK